MASDEIKETKEDSIGIPVTMPELIIIERHLIGALKKIWAIQGKNKTVADMDTDLIAFGARSKMQ